MVLVKCIGVIFAFKCGCEVHAKRKKKMRRGGVINTLPCGQCVSPLFNHQYDIPIQRKDTN